MDVKIISKKLIKPSVPTPSRLQKMSISFIDQLIPPKTVPFIFYYPSNTNYQPFQRVDQTKNRLEKSLSETLTLYYPLAGRYVEENQLINCNDEGVEYVEADVNGRLSQLLQGNIEPEELNRFVVDEVEESATSALVSIQINIFSCGGLAIGLRVSHRIIDAFTFSMFTNGWAKACKEGNINDVVIPNFKSGILFPPRDHIISGGKVPKTRPNKVVTKRFVFDAKTISKLKEEAMSSCSTGVKPKPSTTEVLTALIWRAQINASRARHGRLRTTLLEVVVSLRGKTFKNIPDNCCGNLYVLKTLRFQGDQDESKMGLNEFVDQARNAIRNSIVEYGKALEAGGDGLFSTVMKARKDIEEEIRNGDHGEINSFSSLINFPFYEVDFGWGKPAWVSMTQRTSEVVSFIARKGGDGVEAWVSMEEDDMNFFKNDPDIGLSIKQVNTNGDGIPIHRSKI